MEPQTPVGEIGERALIRHLRSRIPSGPGVIVGVGDDAAAVETGPLTLVTSDTLVEGIHFRREWSPPRLLGRKALSVNLSDIAAMAGLARYATVSLCLPPDIPLAFVDGLYDGLLERAAETGVSLVGGNLSASEDRVVVDVTVLGQGDHLVRRTGGVAGGRRRRPRALPAGAARSLAPPRLRPRSRGAGHRPRGDGPVRRALGRPAEPLRGERGVGVDRARVAARRPVRGRPRKADGRRCVLARPPRRRGLPDAHGGAAGARRRAARGGQGVERHAERGGAVRPRRSRPLTALRGSHAEAEAEVPRPLRGP